MKIGAIITGDIVDSTKLSLAERETMLKDLQSLPEILSPVEKIKIEIFRGDSFQIGIHDAEKSLKAALIVRAFLRSRRMAHPKIPLDARLALGIGTLDYESETLSTSDGEAFRLSGRLLDSMDKSRLEISTPWNGINEELKLSTAFADDIISAWTPNQSRIVLMNLISARTHYEIAQELGISRQMVDKSLRASKEELIGAYIKRFERLITERTKEA